MKTFLMARAQVALLVSGFVLVATPAVAGFAGTDVFLPSVGAKPGIPPAVWYTTVWVHNPNATPANVTFYLLERQANLQPPDFQDTIQPGDTAKYENAIQLMFAKETFGALRVTSNVRVIAGSRIYSQAGELQDSVGQYFAATPASFAIGAGQSTELLGVYGTQPSGDSSFRYNFGFVETTGTGTCEVRVTARDQTGAMYGDKTYTVRQWEQVQKTFSIEFPGLSTTNARLSVEVTSGNGKVIAFGSGVANGSQDPATFEMSFRDEILASSGGGGGTLPAGSAGQTLRSDGSSWLASSALTNDGTHVTITGNLRLPVTATGGSAGALFLGSDRFLHSYGTDNTFLGATAGNLAMSGFQNTATGKGSLGSNSYGDHNTATGFSSLGSNTSGNRNTAAGSDSLSSNTSGSDNTAVGNFSQKSNTSGNANTTGGSRSLERNSTGDFNTAYGYGAGDKNYSGSRNTFIGANSNSNGSVLNATAIGYDATVNGSNHVRIGNTLVTEIGGHVGWTSYSDARQKTDIRGLDLGLNLVLALRPVTFTLKGGDGRTGMGFLAQDIEALLGDGYGVIGIGGDAERTLSLRYTDFIAPLVKAIQEQQAEIAEIRGKLDQLQESLAALRAVHGQP